MTSGGSRRLCNDLGISMLTQGTSAILGLVLVKLSVSLYPASSFGQASLILGVQSLMRSILLQPFLQYFLFHYWNHGDPDRLKTKVSRIIGWCSLGSAPLIGVAMFSLRLSIPGAMGAAGLIIAMAWIEGEKTLRLLPIHLRQEHGLYGSWVLLDALAKPITVFLFFRFFGPTPLSLVGGHVAGSAFVFLLLLRQEHKWNWKHQVARLTGSTLAPSPAFLLPIAALGVTTWISALSDRYFLAHLLGIATAGHYAAVYGIFGAPFVIYTTAITLVVRPKLNAYLLQSATSRYLLGLWISLLAFGMGSVLLALLLNLVKLPLVHWFLQDEYHHALPALPGIFLGQVLMTLGTYLEMHFYLQKRPLLVLFKQGAGALAALISIPWAIGHFGLPGAGWACAFYYGVDLSVALLLAAQTSSKGNLSEFRASNNGT